MDPNGAKSRYKCTLAVSAGKPGLRGDYVDPGASNTPRHMPKDRPHDEMLECNLALVLK